VKRGTNEVRIIATEPIPADTEILIGYGHAYWNRARGRGWEPVAAVVEANSAKAELGSEPKNFREARNSAEWKQWEKGIADEQQSLRDYKVYAVVERSEVPNGAPILTAKWVFKRKLDGNGNVKRHKARLVGRGYAQVAGVHYDETTSSVMQLRSARMLIALSNQLDYIFNMMDVETAYLHAKLDKEIYMRALDSLTGPERGKVLRLQQALYGLKQSGRLWSETLAAELKVLGYTSLEYVDPCLWVRKSKTGRLLIIGTYVDDMPHLWHKDDAKEMAADKAKLSKKFKIVDLGPVTDFLGIKIERDAEAGTTKIHQAGYCTEVCELFGFDPKVARRESTPEFLGDPASSDKVQPGNVTVENFRAVGSI
jgi:hypothetical protein